MKIPTLIPINREEDYHTHYLGTFVNGMQFWAYETFVHDQPKGSYPHADWKNHRKEYVLLHTFDAEGNHIHTQHWYAGTTAECDNGLMDQKLEEMVEELGSIEFGDIIVKLFEVEIDGITFGLIPDENFEYINLQPSSTISFMEPWDGEYYT